MPASHKMRITILGCGSSGGVPRIGGKDGKGRWGACDPDNPKNRRRRCSILVEQISAHDDWSDADKRTIILVDTAPDLREQLLSARVNRLDAVFITHDHADQLHGLDDLRVLAIHHRKRIPVWSHELTSPELHDRFAYCFVQAEGSFYPPILEKNLIPALHQPVIIDGPGGGICVTAFEQGHGGVISLGFRFSPAKGEPFNAVYSSDVAQLPPRSLDEARGADLWIVDALRYTPHPSHANVEQALAWIQQAKAKRGILTNLHIDLDYETLQAETPDNIEPAYDGMVIELP